MHPRETAFSLETWSKIFKFKDPLIANPRFLIAFN